MNNIDIDNLNGDELKIAIAIELGYTPNNWPPYSLGDLPDWPTKIAAAWGLDGDDWLWRTIETPYGVEVFNQFASAYVLFADFSTKVTAYATARCRAWLKAKYAEQECLCKHGFTTSCPEGCN